MKQSIYYLHIPRTSGVLIREVVKTKKPLANILAGHKTIITEDVIKNAEYIIGHYGLTPIRENSKTFTILRNPDERLFSYLKYIWKHFYNYLSVEDAITFFLTDSNFKKNISNQQSKFLTGRLDTNLYNSKLKDLKDMVYSGWCLYEYKEDLESVIKSITENNINILFYEDENLYNSAFSLLSIDFPDINLNNKVNSSLEFSDELYDKFKDTIHSLNLVDWQVYEHFKK